MNSNYNQNNKNNKNHTISPITIARNKNDITADQGWTVKNSTNNKRNHSSSSASDPPSPSTNNQTDQKGKKKIFITPNRYLLLSQDENQNHDETPPSNPTIPITEQIVIDEISPIKPPPPIFVKGVADFPELCKKLIELIGVDNFVCKASADKLKIQTSNPDSYRTLVRYLKEEKAQFHTYQLREDKPLRIVLRNLHPSTPTETIKEELELLTFEVRQVINVLHKVNKNPLPLFFVDLEPTSNSSEIFNLSSLLHTKIKIEEPFKPKSISQCHNCQQYGHTKAYCGYQPHCVRCGLGHLSSLCPNSRELPTKCALCSQNHPANYKGCTIYKDLQRRKKPSPSSNFMYENSKTKFTNVQASHPIIHSIPSQPSPQTQTYAQVTSNAPSDNTIIPPPDINKIMSSFIDDFKSLINPLISLLTKVISCLLDKNAK